MRLVKGARKEVKLKSPVGPAIRDEVGELTGSRNAWAKVARKIR